MGDLINQNRNLIIRRHEHSKLVALAQIEAREIRIIELEDEIERSRQEIEIQRKLIADADQNIKQQREEMAKAAVPAPEPSKPEAK